MSELEKAVRRLLVVIRLQKRMKKALIPTVLAAFGGAADSEETKEMEEFFDEMLKGVLDSESIVEMFMDAVTGIFTAEEINHVANAIGGDPILRKFIVDFDKANLKLVDSIQRKLNDQML